WHAWRAPGRRAGHADDPHLRSPLRAALDSGAGEDADPRSLPARRRAGRNGTLRGSSRRRTRLRRNRAVVVGFVLLLASVECDARRICLAAYRQDERPVELKGVVASTP